jgi:hypothetical protein
MSRFKAVVYICTWLVGLLWSLQAPAQIFKCVDPKSGAITFSDRGCNSGDAATAIKVSPANSSDSTSYRQQQSELTSPYTHQANQEELEQQGPRAIFISETNDNEADQQRKRLCKEASTPHKGAHGLTASQLVAAAQLCAGTTLPAPITTPTPETNTAPSPAEIASCDAHGCWDTNGQRYNKGAGNTHFPANGGPACQLINGNMICP